MIKNYLKIFAVIFLLIGTNLAFANTEVTYEFEDVEVEDISTFGLGLTDQIFVERGEEIKIEVFLQGLGNLTEDISVENVRIEAELGGYDRDTVREVTGSFDVEPGVLYRRTIMLQLPDDLEADKEYQLRVRAYDGENDVDYETFNGGQILLRVREKENLLSIEDISFDPNLNQVNAGDRLYANVRVKNLGFTEEEDVRVIMEIPTLSLSASSFINELNTEEQCDDPDADDECDESQTEQVSLLIPETASGSHEVVIRVEYDNGDEVLEQTFTLDLGAAPQGNEEEAETVIDITPEQQSVAQGEGVAYKIVITNLASESKTYTVSAQDLETWATFDIQPSIVTVAPDSSEEVFIFVTANKDASAGTKFFTATIRSGTTREEVTLEAKITEKEADGIAFDGIRTGLEIGFIILLIILVILGIVLAIRRGSRREEFEEPAAEKGKSYY